MPHKKEYVSQQRLRQIYANQFARRIETKQYTLNELRRGNPAGGANLPQGTKSTIFEIINNQGQKLGVVHAMVLPNGELGASGQHDPKELLVGNTRYLLENPNG